MVAERSRARRQRRRARAASAAAPSRSADWSTTVLAWSVPGMIAGALILRSVDDRILQFALTATILTALAARAVRADR